MKTSRFVLSLFFCSVLAGITPAIAQVVLPEIKIVAVNYKYLNAVNNKEEAMPVKQLEWYASAYDLKNSEFYEDDYDSYYVSFYIPEGRILAAYDKDGKLIRTAEKFKDVAIPSAVRKSIAERFPNWKIAKDVYLVTYHDTKGVTKRYKFLLENGDKRMRIKTDEKGKFI